MSCLDKHEQQAFAQALRKLEISLRLVGGGHEQPEKTG